MSLNDRKQQQFMQKLLKLPPGVIEQALEMLTARDGALVDRFRQMLKREGHEFDRDSVGATMPANLSSSGKGRAVEEALKLLLQLKDTAMSEAPEDEDDLEPTIPSAPRTDQGGDETPAAANATASGDLNGVVLGNKYRIVRLLGRGAFGSVYEGVDEMLGASVAVKVLNADLSGHDSAIGQFLGEARLLTTLDHANIVRWITFDKTPEGMHYFVMEFLRGQELSDVLTEEGQMQPGDVIKMLQQILSALVAAHNLPDGRSLLHLDLKPRNVFVVHGEDRQVKVIDFGISQHVGAAARNAPEVAPAPDKDAHLADLGATMSTVVSEHDTAGGYTAKGVQRALGGTPLYAAPEHCRHLRGDEDIVELDGRADIYSLGIMGWEMLAGRMPWNPKTVGECFENAIESPLPPLPSAGVKIPANLERFLNKCTAKERDQRFTDVRAAKEALDEIANPKRPVLAMAVGFMLVAAVLVWQLWPSQLANRVELSEQEFYFGPDPGHRTAEIQVRNLMDESRTGEVRFVDDTTRQRAQLLEEWEFKLLDGGGQTKVQITPPPDCGLVDEPVVYLEVGNPPQFSQPLHVVYLPSGSCKIAAPQIPGADDRMVDPEGAEVETSLIEGEADWVSSVACQHGDQTLLAVRVEGRETPFYRVPMSDFEALAANPAAPSTFTMTVTDKAGNTHTDTCSVMLATAELTIAPQLLECGTSASVPLLYPGTKPLLRIHAARDVDVEVSARRTDKDEAITVTKEREGSDYRLTIVGPQEAYKANLTVKVRDSLVYHADKERGAKTQILPFQYETAKPALLVTEATAGRLVDPSEPLETPRIVTNQDQISLVLRRDNLVELTVEIACELDGKPMPVEDPLVELHSEAEKTKVIKLPVDGQYSFFFATYRRASERTQAPESAPTVLVARDTAEPSLSFMRAPRDLLQATDDTALATVQVDGLDDGTKLLGYLTGPLERTLELPLSAGALAETQLSFRQFGLQPGELADGSYNLEMVAVDAAGNQGKAGGKAFVVAQQGPSLRLVSPGNNNRWDKEGDQFTVKIQGEDENGIAAVECRLTTSSDKSTGWLAMSPVDAGDLRRGEWRRECILSSMWSGQPVEVAWRGKDAYGNLRAEQTVEKILPTFESQLREQVWNTTPAGESVSMRIVRGAFAYTYGGRGRGGEKATFAKAGLTLDDLGLRFVPSQEDVGNYYLDENEVTIASYLSFLKAKDGYQDARHWRAASPDEDRRKRLVVSLARKDARLPVTGLDWHECRAYAAWCGKRLPTAVEWEYAARGGAQYRAFSCASADFDRGQLAVGVPGPWPVEDGCDRVASGVAEGVRNLCSNVSEWVAGSRAGRCYSAGASFQDGQYHFSILRPTEAGDRSLHTGFRCAADASVVRSQLETGTSLRFSIDATSTSATKDR